MNKTKNTICYYCNCVLPLIGSERKNGRPLNNHNGKDYNSRKWCKKCSYTIDSLKCSYREQYENNLEMRNKMISMLEEPRFIKINNTSSIKFKNLKKGMRIRFKYDSLNIIKGTILKKTSQILSIIHLDESIGHYNISLIDKSDW